MKRPLKCIIETTIFEQELRKSNILTYDFNTKHYFITNINHFDYYFFASNILNETPKFVRSRYFVANIPHRVT